MKTRKVVIIGAGHVGSHWALFNPAKPMTLF